MSPQCASSSDTVREIKYQILHSSPTHQRRTIRVDHSKDYATFNSYHPLRFSCEVVCGGLGLLRLQRLPLTVPLCASR
jgi:hypothetical protein